MEPHVHDLIRADRAAGWKMTALAAKYQIGWRRLAAICGKSTRGRPKGRTAERNAHIAAERAAGATTRELADRYGLGPEAVRRVTRRLAAGDQLDRTHAG